MGLHSKSDSFAPDAGVDAMRIAGDFIAKVVADYAQERLAEAQAKNREALGNDVPYAVVVNSRRVYGSGTTLSTAARAAIRDTFTDGKGQLDVAILIEFLFAANQIARLIRGIARRLGQEDPLAFIARSLRAGSPVRSGAYRDSHVLFGDGYELANAASVAAGDQVEVATEYAFTNFLPYARKIEIGRTKDGRSFVIQVPDRLYQRVTEAARARFSDVIEISFAFSGIVEGRLINQARGRFRRGPLRRVHNTAALRYPTIYIKFR